MNKLSAIQAFAAVAETTSFKTASERLHLSPSAITKLVQRLEESLKVKLLHRSARAVVLTGHGKRYYQRCARILRDLDAAEELLTEDKALLRGKIRLAVSQGGARYLMKHLDAFCQAFPDIDIDILVNNGRVDILQEGCDLWLTVNTEKLNSTGLKRRVLAKLPNVVAASPHYLEKFGTPKSPDDLTDHVCVSLANRSPTWPFRSPKYSKNVRIPRRITVSSGESLIDAALADLSLVRGLGLFLNAEISSGRLTRVLPQYESGHRTLTAIYPSNKYMPEKTKAFLDHLQRAIRMDTGEKGAR